MNTTAYYSCTNPCSLAPCPSYHSHSHSHSQHVVPRSCRQTKQSVTLANSTRCHIYRRLAEMALAIARDVIGRVVGQMQRIDAFLLHQLSNNVQQIQHQFQQPPSGTPEGQTPRGREGFHRIAAGESEMIAIQIAPWTFLTSGYAWSLLIMVSSQLFCVPLSLITGQTLIV